MSKLMLALLALPLFAGVAQAQTPKIPAAIRTDLRQQLKASQFYANAKSPSYTGYVTKNGNSYVANVMLRGLGHSGPVHVNPQPLERVGVATAWVKFTPSTGKEHGKVQLSPIMTAMYAK